jgi:hypothetical protein
MYLERLKHRRATMIAVAFANAVVLALIVWNAVR